MTMRGEIHMRASEGYRLPPPLHDRVYHCGTLSYTARGLIVLFAWLLWGDFCFTLMETVGPSVIPLKLKALGASNTLMSLVMTTLPGILNMTVCPWVSYKSDRHRGRFGRRMPFIFWTMPFLALFLAAAGWSETLAPHVQRIIPALAKGSPATLSIGFIAFFYVAFKFFDMFVGSVYWYLFNDVVPPQFIGRFMGLFRMVGTGAGAIYSYFVFKYAETNMREIMTGGAVIYLLGFGLLCLFVKEGKYPPVPDIEQRKGFFADLKTYGKQCFSVRFYWYFYLMKAFGAAAGACGIFGVFFNKQMGLSLDQMGKLGAWGGLAGLAATYFTAVFVDRWHPLRITTYNVIFWAVGGFGGWVWLYVTLPGDLYFWISLGGMLVFTFGGTLAGGCEIPMFMRLLPKSLYGQFSSANAMIRSIASIVAGLLGGAFVDMVRWLCHGSDYAYRWMFVWAWVWTIASAVFTCLGYREWLRLGGDENYRPPAPWTKEGYEEVADKVKSKPAYPPLVMLTMWLTLVAAAVNLLLVGVFMVYMRRHHLDRAYFWYLHLIVPVKLGLLAVTWAQLVAVRRDIAARLEKRTTRFGIPHHGVLLVGALQGLAYFPVFWYQSIEMIKRNLGPELVIFGIASLLSTAAGILSVQLIRWLERPLKPASADRSDEVPVSA